MTKKARDEEEVQEVRAILLAAIGIGGFDSNGEDTLSLRTIARRVAVALENAERAATEKGTT